MILSEFLILFHLAGLSFCLRTEDILHKISDICENSECSLTKEQVTGNYFIPPSYNCEEYIWCADDLEYCCNCQCDEGTVLFVQRQGDDKDYFSCVKPDNSFVTAECGGRYLDCSNVEDGNYASLESCTEYFNCENGFKTYKSCPRNSLFDTIEKKCLEIAEVRSILPGSPDDPIETDEYGPEVTFEDEYTYEYEEAEPIKCASICTYDCQYLCPDGCPDKPNKRFPAISDDCAEYLDCEDGDGTIERCPDNEYFNSETGECDLRLNANDCGGRYIDCCTAKPWTTLYPSHTTYCGEYYECRNGIKTRKICSDEDPYIVFDVNELRCKHRFEATCYYQRPSNQGNVKIVTRPRPQNQTSIQTTTETSTTTSTVTTPLTTTPQCKLTSRKAKQDIKTKQDVKIEKYLWGHKSISDFFRRWWKRC